MKFVDLISVVLPLIHMPEQKFKLVQEAVQVAAECQGKTGAERKQIAFDHAVEAIKKEFNVRPSDYALNMAIELAVGSIKFGK